MIPRISDKADLERAYQVWQTARCEYFNLLDQSVAGVPMNWEKMTSAIASMDRTIRNVVAMSSRSAVSSEYGG